MNALALLVSLVPLVALEPPPPTELVSGQVPEQLGQEPEPDPAAGDDSPEPAAPPLLQDEAKPDNRPHDNQGSPQEDESPSEWWSWFNGTAVALFTFLLTIVAGLQWWLMRQQSGYMRDELQVTRVAADAAKTSADAAEQTVEQMRLEQRAWLGFVRIYMSNFEPGYPIQTKAHITIRFLPLSKVCATQIPMPPCITWQECMRRGKTPCSWRGEW